MIEWLTYEFALGVICGLGVITYLWYQGSSLLTDTVVAIGLLFMCVWGVFVLGLVVPTVVLVLWCVGIFARLFGRDTGTWISTATKTIISWGFTPRVMIAARRAEQERLKTKYD
jgi:hypothetical protein